MPSGPTSPVFSSAKTRRKLSSPSEPLMRPPNSVVGRIELMLIVPPEAEAVGESTSVVPVLTEALAIRSLSNCWLV
ncbi:hypothetical protein D3C81_2167640 [compost metagenome]